MNSQRALLALAISAGLIVLGGCKSETPPAAGTAGAGANSETADQFVGRFNKTVKDITPEITSAAWLGATFINADSQRVESAANARILPGVGRVRIMQNMDAWGYSFRPGSACGWFEHDAEDARSWLLARGHDLD